MTFRSTLRFSLTSRRKSWRVSTNSRSGVFAVTVAVRLASSSKAISPTKSPSLRVATRLPLVVTSVELDTRAGREVPHDARRRA